MNATENPFAELTFDPAQIQYLPDHRCPQCGAAGRRSPQGDWLLPYQDWFHSELRVWAPHLGYVYYRCLCSSGLPEAGSQRVARRGPAILPLEFVDLRTAACLGLPPAVLNADRVAQAVAFLSRHTRSGANAPGAAYPLPIPDLRPLRS